MKKNSWECGMEIKSSERIMSRESWWLAMPVIFQEYEERKLIARNACNIPLMPVPHRAIDHADIIFFHGFRSVLVDWEVTFYVWVCNEI